MRMLLVEDHDELSLWLQKALAASGFAVDIASDGYIADQLLQTENYSLVVLDVSLPRMNGLDVLAQMRKRHQETPVLLLTANSDVADRVKGLNAGADDYLTKPFDIAELKPEFVRYYAVAMEILMNPNVLVIFVFTKKATFH